jgi:uncharacterized protein YeaO (DUF488 family)
VIEAVRVYDSPHPKSGARKFARFLVERLWPRGMKKDSLKINGWLKEVAPSTKLRHWYAHKVERWAEFRRRYLAELRGNPSGWQPLLEAARRGNITLLYSARDTEHNSAVVLRNFLTPRLK